MTISRHDVHELSRGLTPGGVALSAAEGERVAGVLNQHSSSHHPEDPTEPAGDGTVPAAAGDLTLDLVAAEPVESGDLVPREQVLAVMRRAGYAAEQVEHAAAGLPDQIDTLRDRALLSRYVLTPGQLMDRMGSSP